MIIQLYSSTHLTSAFNYDHPAEFYDSSDLSFRLWSSSCILRLVRPQPSTSIIQLHFYDSSDLPAAFYDSTYASYPRLRSSCAHLHLNYTSYQRYQSSWRPYSTITDLTHVCRSDNKLSFVIFVTSPLFLHCLWLSLTHTHETKFICGVNMFIGSATHSYRSCDNRIINIPFSVG